MIEAGKVMIGQRTISRIRRGNLNDDRITTDKRTGGVASCREMSKGRRGRADAGVYIKAPITC
jgi:hypothetical protein